MKFSKRLRLSMLRGQARLAMFLKMAGRQPAGIKKDGTVIVVCAASEDYAKPLAAMAASLVLNFRRYSHLALYVLENNISPGTREKIGRLFDNGRFQLRWIKADAERFKGMKVRDHITVETYFRLLIPEILPPEVDKAIYLDCDLVVHDDIGGLWDIAVDEHCVLAAPEMHRQALFVSSPSGISFYKELGISPAARIFNNGVMVVNVRKWREDSIAARIMDCQARYKDRFVWCSQDGMNAVLVERYGAIDPRWNQLTQLLYEYDSWEGSPLSRDMYEKTVRAPYIIHFNTGSKPWHKGSVHPFRDLFFYYLDKTAWKGWRPGKVSGKM